MRDRVQVSIVRLNTKFIKVLVGLLLAGLAVFTLLLFYTSSISKRQESSVPIVDYSSPQSDIAAQDFLERELIDTQLHEDYEYDGEKPNFIIIYTDDQGFNDLGCFGSPDIRTPNIDKMAEYGMKFTSFYAAPVCTPSRAALMTGCYPKRNGMSFIPSGSGTGLQGVIRGDSLGGLHPAEITIAEELRMEGYVTGIVGKWHLGDTKNHEFSPESQGFDFFYRPPYAISKGLDGGSHRINTVIQDLILSGEEESLVEYYTRAAISFIEKNRNGPFFLYLAHNMPHRPLHVGKDFVGKSEYGVYGDVIEEIDASTGRILNVLTREGLANKTLVVFASDNGPVSHFNSPYHKDMGRANPFSKGKATTYEGGMRVPCVMFWPEHIPPNSVCNEIASNMDLFPTFIELAGGEIPDDRIIDGKNILPLMFGRVNAKSPHKFFYYYRLDVLEAVRGMDFKLRLRGNDPPTLHYLPEDPEERRDLANQYPSVVRVLQSQAQEAASDLGSGDVQGENVRPIGFFADYQ